MDDELVRGAVMHEDTAAERVARLRRIAAEHRRLEADQDAARRHERRASQRGSWKKRAAVGSVLLVLAGVGVGVLMRHEAFIGSVGGEGDAATSVVRVEGGQPPPGVDAQTGPIGTPEPVAAGSGSHRFLNSSPEARARSLTTLAARSTSWSTAGPPRPGPTRSCHRRWPG